MTANLVAALTAQGSRLCMDASIYGFCIPHAPASTTSAGHRRRSPPVGVGGRPPSACSCPTDPGKRPTAPSSSSCGVGDLGRLLIDPRLLMTSRSPSFMLPNSEVLVGPLTPQVAAASRRARQFPSPPRQNRRSSASSKTCRFTTARRLAPQISRRRRRPSVSAR